MRYCHILQLQKQRGKREHLPQRQFNNKQQGSKKNVQVHKEVTHYLKFRTLQYTGYKEKWKGTKGRMWKKKN